MLVKLDGIVAIARLDRLAVFVPALLLGLSGCVSLGSEAIQGSRTQYNLALLETDDEQLLLNLVRLRYRDRVLFLEASSLTTQFNFTATAGVAYGYQSNARENSVVRGGVVVQEKPTVTYAPLQGRDFVERVLSRISLETLLLLSGSGWNPERVFRVCIERMNGLRNATHADGPTPDMAPSFEEFVRATRLLRELRDQDMFSGARGPVEDAPVLRFRPEAAKLAEYRSSRDCYASTPAGASILSRIPSTGWTERRSISVPDHSWGSCISCRNPSRYPIGTSRPGA